MSKLSIILILISIFCIRITLQFYQLGSLPAGFTWDEAAIGYNGYAVITTRRDEWIERLPVSFRSFGDYKAPLAIYVVGVFTFLLGLEPWVVRLPFAVSGVIAVGLFYWLLRLIFSSFKHGDWYSILGTVLLAFSPWHLHFTRTGFESGLSLTVLLAGLVSLFSFFSTTSLKQSNSKRVLWLLAATVFFAMSFYTYHSAKIVAPLFLLATLVVFSSWKMLWNNWKSILFASIIGLGILLPLVKDTLYGQGATRANVLIFNEDMPANQMIGSVISNTVYHLSPHFLILGATNTLRHGTGVWGVLFLTTWLLSVAGVVGWLYLLYSKKFSTSYKLGLYGILLTISGLLPAILTLDVPHPNRALLALPGFLLLACLGFYFITQYLSKHSLNSKYYLIKSWIGTFVIIHLLLFVSFWHFYLTIYPTYSSDAFQEGYVEAFKLAKEYEKGENGKPEVDKILFSNEYGQPYIYALFVRKTNPIWYQSGSLIKYEFTDSIKESDLARSKTLLVSTKSNILPSAKATHVLYGKDGSIRFAFYLTE